MDSVFGQLIFGWLMADFLTGIFHWWEDRLGNEKWFLIGPWIIVPNRLHHKDPLAFISNGFWVRNRAAMTTSALVGAGFVSFFGWQIWIASMVVGSSITNEIHAFAHSPKLAPKWVKVLQEIGLFQSPKEHSRHHRPPFETHFCVLTNYLNPVLEWINFWRIVEFPFRKTLVRNDTV